MTFYGFIRFKCKKTLKKTTFEDDKKNTISNLKPYVRIMSSRYPSKMEGT